MSNVFDAHFHIIDPDFPLVENNGYLPPAFCLDDYQTRVAGLKVNSGALVSGSFQAFDQSYLLAALNALNSPTANFVGVTQIPVSMTDQQILALNEQGVRAVRFNAYRGGSESLRHIEAMARRVYSLAKWHVELYLSSESLIDLFEVIKRLPSASIDHLGMDKSSSKQIDQLVAEGVSIKATGFGRVNFDAVKRVERLYGLNHQAIMFGTDLPSTRARRAFIDSDLYSLKDALSAEAFERVTYINGREFYRLDPRNKA